MAVHVGVRHFAAAVPSCRFTSLQPGLCHRPQTPSSFTPDIWRSSQHGWNAGRWRTSAFNLPTLNELVSSAEQPPPQLYFWYLIAAGCGIPLPEDPMVMWVGMQLAREILPEVQKTLLLIYAGVILSDWIPFFVAVLVRKGILGTRWLLVQPDKAEANPAKPLDSHPSPPSKEPPDEGSKSKETAFSRARKMIQASGRSVGIVARFSPGLRTPLFIAAGLSGVSPLAFCIGDLLGGMATMAIQLSIGSWLASQAGSAMVLLSTATAVFYAFGGLMGIGLPAVVLYLREKKAQENQPRLRGE